MPYNIGREVFSVPCVNIGLSDSYAIEAVIQQRTKNLHPILRGITTDVHASPLRMVSLAASALLNLVSWASVCRDQNEGNASLITSII